MIDLLQTIATLATGLFTGAAIYINLVEHPARMQCGIQIAAAQWAPSYKRATIMQVTLGLVGSGAGFAVWLLQSGTSWLVGTILLFAVIPYTIVAILPTNTKLLEPSRDKGSAETEQLLERWAKLHAVRSFLSLAAFLTFLVSR